jgi:uncharacterized membrane protein
MAMAIGLSACVEGKQKEWSQYRDEEGNQDEIRHESPSAQFTFSKDILPLVKIRCTVCHSQDSSLPFWEDYDVLFQYKEIVRSRVFEIQDMPTGNATQMTPEERKLMAVWIDEGATF